MENRFIVHAFIVHAFKMCPINMYTVELQSHADRPHDNKQLSLIFTCEQLFPGKDNEGIFFFVLFSKVMN